MWSRPLKSTPFILSTDAITETIYPVGSIYMSTVDIDPSTLFGGTWERIKDKFLLTAGDSYSAGTTGGTTSHTHTNPNTSTLSANTGAYSGTSGSTAITTDQMPSHSHVNRILLNEYCGSSENAYPWEFYLETGKFASTGGSGVAEGIVGRNTRRIRDAGYTGGGQGHTHSIPSHTHSMNHSHTVGNTGSSSSMPPYLTVYCWRRTA